MTDWVLIIFLITAHGSSVHSVDFRSEVACAEAVEVTKKVYRENKDNILSLQAHCTPK